MLVIEQVQAQAYLLRLQAVVRAWAGDIPWVIGALIALGVFVRLYRLETLGWIPDTYERLDDAARIASLGLPRSQFSPPGAALLIAPLFLFLPHTLMTMQYIVIAAGVLLIPVAYKLSLDAADDKLTATIFAFATAFGPAFVHFSRDGLYDMITTLLAALAVLLVPRVAKGGIALALGYGLLLTLLVNVRQTNLILIPIVFVYWLSFQRVNSLSHLLSICRSKPIAAVSGALFVGMTVSIVFGGWLGETANGTSAITPRASFANMAYYAVVLVNGPVGCLFVVPLALAGARRLWQTNRTLLLVSLTVVGSWCLMFSPFPFHMFRYMLPALFFVFMLMCLGLRPLWSFAVSRRPWAKPVGAYLALSVFALSAQFMIGSVTVLDNWPTRAAQSDEGMFREVRPVLAQLPAHTLLVSAVSRGLVYSNPNLDYLDLIDQTVDHGTSDASVDDVTARIERELVQGNAVYYLYTRWEAGADFQGGGIEGYRRYFEGVARNFRTVEVFESRELNLEKFRWTLYRIEKQPAVPAFP